jgi:hypothetical protein
MHNSSTQLPSELPAKLLFTPLVWVHRGSIIPPLQLLYNSPYAVLCHGSCSFTIRVGSWDKIITSAQTKRPATECPVTKRPWEKMSGGTKCPGEKTSGGTKRPGGQNIRKGQNVRRQNEQRDKRSVGTKRPWGQNIRREKENVPQGKKSPLISGRKLVIISGNIVGGRKNVWQGKKSPLSKFT